VAEGPDLNLRGVQAGREGGAQGQSDEDEPYWLGGKLASTGNGSAGACDSGDREAGLGGKSLEATLRHGGRDLGANRPGALGTEEWFGHAGEQGLQIIAVRNQPAPEDRGRAGDIGDEPGDETAGAALDGCKPGTETGQPRDDGLLERLTTGGEDVRGGA
jgi:hypothetical protein